MVEASTRSRGRAIRGLGFTTGWRSFPWFLVQAVEQGAYRLDHGRGSARLGVGDIWFVPAGCRHRHSVIGDVSVTTVWWQGQVRQHAAIDPFASLGRPRVFPRAARTALGRAFQGAAGEPAGGDLASELADQARVMALAAELVRALGESTLSSSRLAAATSLAPVFRFIEANLHLPMERGELAARAGLAPSRFHEIFLAATGESPMAWVRGRRLAQAAELLAGTDLGMAEIARQSGFCDQFHLNKRFRAAYGMPPTMFRARAKG